VSLTRRVSPPVVPRDLGPPHPAGAVRWQVFGLVGEACGPPTGRRFPAPRTLIGCPRTPVLSPRTDRSRCAADGGRSHLPLRGSPGFAPGSLLPRRPWRGRRTSCVTHHMSRDRRFPVT